MPAKKTSSSQKKKNKSIGQMTETGTPNKRLTGKQLTIEIGGSGTNLMNGIIEEDYNAALLGTIGLEIYDQMRKSDAQVHATLLYCELPILSTKWTVKPAQNEEGMSEPEDEEIAEFVRSNLFDNLDKSFMEVLREVLTMLPFGHAVFEPVWEIDEDQVWLKKLGWRKPTTIDKWETEDRTAGITQTLPDGRRVSIPADKLLIFSLRREGDNYAGQSILRTAYRHWYLKDRFYRFDSIKHERQALGVLKVRMPPDASPEDEAKALGIIERLRAIEQAGVTIPGSAEGEQGWEADFMDMKAGTTSNLEWSINHHDRKIATNILAQFMELGSDGGGGSYALSEDQSSLYLQSVGTVASYIREVFNRHLIQKMVDYNYDVEKYPTLEYDRLGETKITDFTSAIASAAGAGMLTADRPTEAAIRERLNLPPQQAPEEGDDMDDPELQDGLDDEPEDGDDDLLSGMEDVNDDEPEEEQDVDLSELFFSECIALSELGDEHVFEVIELAKGKPLTEEHKKAISEALKGRGKGGKEPTSTRQRRVAAQEEQMQRREAAQDRVDSRTAKRGGNTKALLQQKSQLVNKIQNTRQTIADITARYTAAIEAAGTPAERKALRAEKKAILTPLKAIRNADIQTRIGVNKVLRARRKELSNKIKAIRTALKAKRIDMKAAVEPLKNEVASNNDQIKKLRAKRKGMKGEQSKALLRAIEGLLEDNATIRASAKVLRDEYGAERDAATAKIDAEKEAAGFLSEHHHQHDPPMFFELSQLLNNETIIQLQNEVEPLQLAEAKKKGLRTNDYERKAFRPLTLSERKVNFSFIERSMKQATSKLEDKFSKAIQRAKAALVDQIRFAVKHNDVKALGKAAVPKDVVKEMASVLTDVQKEMFEVGKRTAAQELNAGTKPGEKGYVGTPPTSAEIRGAMRVQNDAIAGKIVWNLEAVAVRAATEAIQKANGSITDTTQKAAVDAVKEAMDAEIRLSESQEESVRLCEQQLDDVISLAEDSATTLSVTGSINMGRGSIFARYPEKVYGFQFSAILDGRTTAICMSLDGMVVRPGSGEYAAYSPPRHRYCRSIWVAILMEETFKPEFTDDIPSSIPKGGNAMNAPTMKAPVVSSYTSPKTLELINEEIATRAAKVKQYTEAGTHATRIQNHKEKISVLKKGLQGAEVGVKKTMARKVTVDGEAISTPTGFVYATLPTAAKTAAKKGLPSATVSTAAFGGEGTLYRIPAGEAAKLKPKKVPGAPAELQSFTIQNAPADIIEVWDETKEEWVPVRARKPDVELAEVFRGILMADGIRFTVRT